MEPYFGYRLLLLGCIVVANAFFAAAELALVSSRLPRLRELAAQGHVGAQAAVSLLSHPERLLSTAQVGVTLAGLGAGWAGQDTLYQWLVVALGPLASAAGPAALHTVSFLLAFLALTYVMVVVGEVAPKNLAIREPERLAVLVAPPLLVFHRAFRPFVFVLERSSEAISRLLGLGREGAAHSIEDLKLMAKSIRASGRLSAFENDTVDRALGLRDIAVREIMVPRHDIVSIQAGATLSEALHALAGEQHARLPVYEKEPEHITGILHYKDLLVALARRRPNLPEPRVRSVMRKHLVVPETKPLDQMIDEFRHHHAHMAMVVDEFGTIVGLVTLEDVLEQVFGEIEDEHDAWTPEPDADAAVLELDGATGIRDLEAHHGLVLPANAGFETLAGFLLFRLGSIPQAGDSLDHEGRRFTVLEMERLRIAKVRIERLAAPAP